MRATRAAAALLVAVVAAAAQQHSGAHAAELKACRGDKGDLNVLLGTPRRNLGFSKVSGDLGSYASPIELCTDGSGEESICQAAWVDELSAGGIDAILDQDPDEDSWINYGQSVMLYSFIGVAFAVLAVLAGLGACCIRCCCCRGVGVRVSEDPDKDPAYPMWQTVGTYGCLLFFIIIMFTFTILAHVRGNKGFTEAQLALVDAPDGVVALAQGVSSPAVSLLTSLVGNTTVNLIRRVNATVAAEADLEQVHESVTCAREIYDVVTNTSLVDTFLAILDDVQISISVNVPDSGDVSAAVTDVTGDIDTLEVALQDTATLLGHLDGNLSAVPVSDIEADVASVQSQVGILGTTVGNLKDDLTSYLSIQPTLTDLVDLIGDIIDGTSYLQTDVQQFQTDFTAFNSAVGALPDEDDLKADLVSVNTSLDALDALLISLEADIALVQNVPSLATVDSSLTSIIAAIDSFNFTALESELALVTNFFLQLPSVTPITDKIAEIVALQANIPCIFEIVNVPQDVNDNLVELPGEFLNITSQFDELNATLTDATAQLDTVLLDITSFASSFNGTLQNATAVFNAELDVAETALATARQTVVDLQAELNSIDTSALNVSSALDNIGSVRTQLADPGLRPTAATLTNLDDAKTARLALQAGLDLFVLPAPAAGKVNTVATTNPADDWECDNQALVFCWTQGGAGFVAGACTLVGDIDCKFPYVEWNTLRAGLTAFNTSINDVNPSLRDEVVPQLGNTQTELASVDLSCCTDFSEIEAALADVQSAGTDIQTAIDDVGDIRSNVQGLEADFTNSLGDSTTFNATFDDLKAELQSFNTSTQFDGLEDLEFVFEKEEAIYNLLTRDLEPILQEISTARLDQIAAGDDGLVDLVVHVAGQLDAIVAAVEPDQATLSDNIQDALDIVRIIDATRDNDGSRRAVGSIYYLERVAAAASSGGSGTGSQFRDASYFAAFENPTVEGPIVDGRIGSYPDDVLCITDECLKNSIEFYNNDKISNVAPQEINNIAEIPVSRTTAMGVPFIIPGLVIAIAVATFFLPQCGYVLACCSVCIMPWIFVIIGGLIFPMLILTADTCASAESIGVSVMTEVQPFLCSQINGTVNANGFCEVLLDVPPLTSTVELDTPAILQSMLNECSGTSSANLAPGQAASEPVAALYESFGLDAAAIVQSQVATLLDELLPDLGLNLRPQLRTDVNASSQDLQNDIQNFSANLGGAVGCQQINDAYIGFKDTVCCDFGSSFYWSFAGWYLIAFSMLFCGLPVGCFAATRLRNIKRSRQQLREFYERSGSAIATSRVGRAAARGTAYAVAVVSPADGGVGEDGLPVANEAKPPSRLARLGDSFRQGAASAGSGAATVRERFRARLNRGGVKPEEDTESAMTSFKADPNDDDE